MKILKYYKELIDPIPNQIVYAYGQYHSYIPQLQSDGITTHAGLPSEDFIASCTRPLLLVLDDLMLAASEEYLNELFTKKSHHEQIGVIFLTQNLFEKNLKVARTNSQYIILTRSPNAILSIRTLGSQLFPRQLNYFMDSYNKATKEAYGYLLLDMHAASNQSLRLRTNIFPNDLKTLFIPKNA